MNFTSLFDLSLFRSFISYCTFLSISIFIINILLFS